MAYLLSEQHELMRRTVREFAEKEITLARSREIDDKSEFPWDLVKRAAELNLFGVTIPEEYGGVGSDMLSRAIAMEEISRANATLGIIVGASGLCADSINIAGTDEQKRKYLVPLAKGEVLGAFGLTEPGAGSDAAAQQSTAVRDGNFWVINGTKCFITNCGPAEVYVVIAKTPEEEGVRGPSAFIVEKGTPGFTIGKLEEKLGLHGSATGELIFSDCRVPAENLLGQLGRGLHTALQVLDLGRICIAAMGIGIAQASLEAAVEFAKQRKTFGVPIVKHQAIAFYLAEMATKIEAARSLNYRAASLCDAGQPFTKEAAMAKYFAGEIAVWCADRAIQIHGGYGYSKNFPVERYWREAKLCEIGEGTSEIQKIVISRLVTG
ncbi:MAG: acyl-CoA dehydrogenase [Firmicutes bacterium]|nr:acyl-CoA dehydrogenase [Bacillota bacterium]